MKLPAAGVRGKSRQIEEASDDDFVTHSEETVQTGQRKHHPAGSMGGFRRGSTFNEKLNNVESPA